MARIILVCALLGCLVACRGAPAGGKLSVVASTNVYGDIARQIGGSYVSVTSVLTDPNADPHLFEPGTANGLSVSRARVVIENGLGYDAFMSRLEQAAPSDERRSVTISDVLGVHGRSANPHLWYDVPALGKIAAAVQETLADVDAVHAADYRRGRRRFVASLAPLRGAVAAVRGAHPG
ncbi:MAG: zinc/manganese transport system substrate-binding protein, partial [Gaiellaceae bacterium]|nr:zinc/manganese transport system substrate-binding protein [Gaiellaceae bacterium]